jgi:hypothetical protein
VACPSGSTTQQALRAQVLVNLWPVDPELTARELHFARASAVACSRRGNQVSGTVMVRPSARSALSVCSSMRTSMMRSQGLDPPHPPAMIPASPGARLARRGLLPVKALRLFADADPRRRSERSRCVGHRWLLRDGASVVAASGRVRPRRSGRRLVEDLVAATFGRAGAGDRSDAWRAKSLEPALIGVELGVRRLGRVDRRRIAGIDEDRTTAG